MSQKELISLEYIDSFDNNISKKLEFSSSLLENKYNLNSLYTLIVDGESMQPLIQDRALVVADLSQKDIIDDSTYLISHKNKVWIKKAKICKGETTFISINKEYSHLIFSKNDIHLIAKVLLTFTKL
jgi:phage repressor protein C with HTH and peptisase S24 domain